MKAKNLTIVLMLVVGLIVMSGLASAFSGDVVKSIEINDRPVFTSSSLGGSSDFRINSLEAVRGELLNIEVRIEAPATEDIKDIEVTARFVYEYSDVVPTWDSTSLFEIDAGDTVFKDLQIRIPKDIDEQSIDLHIMILDRNDVFTQDIRLHLKGKRHDLEIERVLFTPQNVVKAGSFLIGKVRLENFGDKDEDDILVTAEVLGLEGAYDADTIDEIEKDESLTSEELYLPIPLCAPAGRYPVHVEVVYDNDRSKRSFDWEIMVEESGSDVCSSQGSAPAQPAVSVGGANQAHSVQAGGNVGVPVTVTNTGKSAQTYVLTADATGWATVRYDPSNVIVVQPGQTITAFAYADVLPEAEGTKWLSLSVKSGSEVVSQAAVQVNVTEAAKSGKSVRKTLETVLIVLVVLIVILILVIGFNRLNSDEDDEDEDGKTYY